MGLAVFGIKDLMATPFPILLMEQKAFIEIFFSGGPKIGPN